MADGHSELGRRVEESSSEAAVWGRSEVAPETRGMDRMPAKSARHAGASA